MLSIRPRDRIRHEWCKPFRASGSPPIGENSFYCVRLGNDDALRPGRPIILIDL